MATATIVRDIFHLILRASSYDRILNRFDYFKITVNAVEQDAQSIGKYTVYDNSVQPHYFAYIFYGLFEVSQPDSTLDAVDIQMASSCGRYRVRLYILATEPLVIAEPGIYGIMIVYEYRPPETAPVRIQT